MKRVMLLIIILSVLPMRAASASLDQSFEVTVTPITPMINNQMIEETIYNFQIKAKNINCNLRAGDLIPGDTTTFLGKMEALVSFDLCEGISYQVGYSGNGCVQTIRSNETDVEMDYPSIGQESTAIFSLSYSPLMNERYIDPRHLMEYSINVNLGLLSQATPQGSGELQIIITYIYPFVGHTFSHYNVISQDKINFQTSYLQDLQPLITKIQSTDSKYGLDTLLNYQKAVTSGDYYGADDIIGTPDLYYQRTLFEYLNDEAKRISELKIMQQTIDANNIEKANLQGQTSTLQQEKAQLQSDYAAQTAALQGRVEDSEGENAALIKANGDLTTYTLIGGGAILLLVIISVILSMKKR